MRSMSIRWPYSPRIVWQARALYEPEELEELWADELEALEGIFEDDFGKVSRSRCEVKLRCQLGTAAKGHYRPGQQQAGSGGSTEQEVRIVTVALPPFGPTRYPVAAPLVAFICKPR